MHLKALFKKQRNAVPVNEQPVLSIPKTHPEKPFQAAYLIITIMQRSLPILLLCCLQAVAYGYGQTITLAEKDTPLEKVFRNITNQSGYLFFYTNNQLKKASPVTLTVRNESIETVLQQCFRNQPFTYEIINKTIVLKDLTGKNNITSNEARGIIRGIVSGVSGPLEGASIRVKNTSYGTTTNERGQFVINTASDAVTLVISYVGYETIEIAATHNDDLRISLVAALRSLDETIVRGYYSTTRRLNTGSVARIQAKDIEKQPVSNPLAVLQGRVPGLFITQNTGLPGADFKILIRGRNSFQSGTEPLYLVDGVPFISQRLTQLAQYGTGSPFNSINPNDIESIEVLKDADATAIYGSRGANGVVLINTKRGKSGKSTVDFSFSTGWGKITRAMDYLNTKEYLEMRREAFRNDSIIPGVSTAPDLFLLDTTKYTNWKKELIGGTARTTQVQARLSGGNEQLRYSVGGNYYKETTVFAKDMGANRQSAFISLSHQSPNNKFSAQVTTTYGVEQNELPRQDITPFINKLPHHPASYDSIGRLVFSQNGMTFINPHAFLLQRYQYQSERLTTNTLLSYKILPSLLLRASAGMNTAHVSESSITPVASQNPAFNPTGNANFGNSQSRNWIAEPQLEYNTRLARNTSLQLLAGSTFQQNNAARSIIRGSGYTNDNLIHSTVGATSTFSEKGNSVYKYHALFGRIHVNWNNQLMVNITGRRDASSRFAPGKQFANFGAVGVAWNFTKLQFVQQHLSFLSFGKLRGSYGITGNDQIGDHQYLDTWMGGGYPYQGQSGLQPSRIFNDDYSWEQNSKLEAAIELGFMKDRLFVNVNWFRHISKNQIISYSLPSQTGFTSVLKNFPGVVLNTGWEIEVSGTPVRNELFNWSTAFNVTIPRNELLEFPGLESSSYARSYIIGKPLDINRGYNYLGVDPQTGIYQFEDANKDNRLNNNDYVYNGTTNPVFYGGLENSLKWKQWQLDFHFYFVKQKAPHVIYQSFNANGDMLNQSRYVLDRWQKPGDHAPYERYTADFSNPAYYPATFFIARSSAGLTDASYARLRNVALWYTLPSKWTDRMKLQLLKIYVQAQNLMTITNYEGPDPEIPAEGTLPPLRMIVTGFQLTL